MQYNNLITFTSLLFICSTNFSVKAQIIPDNNLPNNTTIKLDGDTRSIEGGTQVGSNVFHSFKDFSVPTGTSVHFNNGLDIQNIITRITGGSISNIDGLISANGAANLFLLNPNGIVFGQNARLDIGGSFLASTGNRLIFRDGFEFSATHPQTTPLLSINVPIGLQLSTNPRPIRVEGAGHNLIGLAFSPVVRSNSLTGLRVQPGRTLALVGGDVILEGGTITAEGGRIEIGSVGNNGLVNINPTTFGWNLEYKNVFSFQDISLSKRALADASGITSGSIQMQGHNITFTDGSVSLIQNQGSLSGGTLKVNASEFLDISGTDPVAMIAGSLRNETVGLGKAGDIAISSKHLIIRDGGQINALTFSAATSGNIVVKSSDSIQLLGVSPRNPGVFSSIGASTFNSGDAGNIELSTGRLIIKGGGALTSSTFGTGTGGNVTANAFDFISVTGYAPIIFQQSIIGTTTLNTGKAGNLRVNTSKLIVRNGGRVDASTLASGDSGSVTINASKSVDISGAIPGSKTPSLVNSSANVVAPTLQNLFRLPPVPSGKSGDVTINTESLNVTKGAQVSVMNAGLGDAGKLEINANRINVTNNGGITATTAVGQGGDIDINSNLLQLRDGNISATAGQQGSNGDGGNVTINTKNLFSLGDSSITANAFEGRGGNIKIDTKGLFLSANSQITASSERGVNGTVEVNFLIGNNVQPKIELEAVQTDTKIASVCQGRSDTIASTFVVSGHDGLFPSRSNLPSQNPIWQDNSLLDQSDNDLGKLKSRGQEPTQILEAQAVVQESDGRIFLTTNSGSVSANSASSANPCADEIRKVGLNQF
ncbi:two-partner secretion domain-containing protein [aff. Roholtiella sp. LEGE 12411]|uniref:two-partner secretion domain-containing protein n=1 Tax=aff. Roholtiella sp. LEGE 12411 TaxID=1828822 RepID=UPI00188146DA|nr:filamentous hemagglutinin N-terminal domain-containing protein [aff. Roholtiella sp. LEGE 12411]